MGNPCHATPPAHESPGAPAFSCGKLSLFPDPRRATRLPDIALAGNAAAAECTFPCTTQCRGQTTPCPTSPDLVRLRNRRSGSLLDGAPAPAGSHCGGRATPVEQRLRHAVDRWQSRRSRQREAPAIEPHRGRTRCAGLWCGSCPVPPARAVSGWAAGGLVTTLTDSHATRFPYSRSPHRTAHPGGKPCTILARHGDRW